MKNLLPLIALVAALATSQAAAADGDAAQFTRHKHLVEHITSQGCAYCPWGDHVLEQLAQMRGDIADVNAVINIMLGKTVTSDESLVTSDVTGDGTVDIADVNAVINIMLGN